MDATTRAAIGRQLRTIYDRLPKGAVPERIRLLLIEIGKAERRA